MPAFRTSCPRTIAILTFLLFCSPLGNSYSVLTHEEIVDLLWKQKIQPLLLNRFPDATEEDLRKAHAYAYGGCVLQDMGATIPSATNISAISFITSAAAIS